MSTPATELPRRHRFTVADYHRMAESGVLAEQARVELIEGAIVDMTPIGSTHAGTVNRLLRLLSQAVGDQAIVAVQNPVILGDLSEPQPDLSVLRPREDFYTRSHPGPGDVLLIIEVADTTVRYEREVKAPLYARHAIPELWIVDLPGGRLHVHRAPGAGGYGQVLELTSPGRLAVPGLPDVSVDLSSV